MGTSSIASSRALARTARRQLGCFTASQAVEAGYRHPLHVYHVSRGDWVRLARGIYRLASAPDTPAVRLVAALLWPRNKAGAVPCALAGAAADAVRAGKADAFSGPVELAVPQSFRYRSSPPAGVAVRALAGERVPAQAIGPFRVLAAAPEAGKAARPGRKSRKNAEFAPKPAGKRGKTARKPRKTVEERRFSARTTQERADWFDELDFRRVVEDIRAALAR